MHGENKDPGVPVPLAYVAHRLKPAGAGQGDVHDGDVGTVVLVGAIGFLRVAGFGTHLKSGLALEQPAVAFADDRMIVNEQDANRRHAGTPWKAGAGPGPMSGMTADRRRPRAALPIDRLPPRAATLSRIPRIPCP